MLEPPSPEITTLSDKFSELLSNKNQNQNQDQDNNRLSILRHGRCQPCQETLVLALQRPIDPWEEWSGRRRKNGNTQRYPCILMSQVSIQAVSARSSMIWRDCEFRFEGFQKAMLVRCITISSNLVCHNLSFNILSMIILHHYL